jgi:hypothetical protein
MKTNRDADGNIQTVPSATHGKWMRWRARYVDEDGREHARGFARKADAQSWLDTEITAKFATGTYIDPQRGKVTFSSFYTEWASRQVWVSGTTHSMDLAAKSVTFANVGLADIRPSHVEAWVKTMQDKGLEPTTIRTRFANVRDVLRAAVRDRFMPRDVTAGVKLPRARKASAAMYSESPGRRCSHPRDGRHRAVVCGIHRGVCVRRLAPRGGLRAEGVRHQFHAQGDPGPAPGAVGR